MPPNVDDHDEACQECNGVGLVDCDGCGGTGDDGDERCDVCDGQATLPCQACGGAGFSTLSEGCQECEGSGVRVADCPACEGRGATKETCQACGGSIVNDQYEGECPECGTDGFVAVDCDECGATGEQDVPCDCQTVQGPPAPPGMSSDQGLPDCHKCLGTGQLPRRDGTSLECKTCGGSGKAESPEPEDDDYASTSYERLHGVRQEGFAFDRFMDDIVIKEGTQVSKIKTTPDSPQRVRAHRHQERPLGRIRYGVK